MIAVRWNDGTKSIDSIGYRDPRPTPPLQPGR